MPTECCEARLLQPPLTHEHLLPGVALQFELLALQCGVLLSRFGLQRAFPGGGVPRGRARQYRSELLNRRIVWEERRRLAAGAQLGDGLVQLQVRQFQRLVVGGEQRLQQLGILRDRVPNAKRRKGGQASIRYQL